MTGVPTQQGVCSPCKQQLHLKTVNMALRRGFAGLVPRLLNTTEALAPICTSSGSLLQADATPSSSGNPFGAYTSFLRSEWLCTASANCRSSSGPQLLTRMCLVCHVQAMHLTWPH